MARTIASSFNGNAVTASLEAGTTFKATEHWSIEPQGQIIWQYQNFDEAHDPGGSINYDNKDAFTGRVGVRLQGNTTVKASLFRPSC